MSDNKTSDKPEIWGGMECTTNRVEDRFLDQLDYTNYYTQSYAQQVADLGIKKVRFPVLWEKHQPQRDTVIDWTWVQSELSFFKKNGIDVIAGLVHHGSGPAFTDLLDPEFPQLLAQYARQVATRFPHIRYYTPVNEPLTTARFSGLYGHWYPHAKHDRKFLVMLLNQLKGVVLSMQEIRKVNPEAQLVQTEDLGKTYSTHPLRYQARFENERRWLTYDLLCGRVNEKHKLWRYFKKFAIPPEDLQFFIENPCTPEVFGFNHYVTSERYLDHRVAQYPRNLRGGNKKHKYVDTEVARVELDEETGIKVLLREAWDRYRQPMAVTEVHLHCHREEQLRWFKYVYNATSELRREGVDVKAITAWAVLGSYGWDNLLRKPRGEYEPGAYDLRSGKPRPTALAAYIIGITADSLPNHHLVQEKGWWQRESRLIYAPAVLSQTRELPKENRIAIIGKRGTLGRAFAKVCTDRALGYKLLSREECDIGEPHSIEEMIRSVRPWAIINAAGYVRVDEAESDEETCYRENAIGPYHLAGACERNGVRLVTFSSDLVFDGARRTPYLESHTAAPLNVYGKSKLLGEEHVLLADPTALIVRTSAFFGPWDRYNFLHWVENNLSNGLEVPAANDNYISPTYVPDLVHATLDLLIDGESGLWHLANKGSITWADLAYLAAKHLKYSGNCVRAIPGSHLNLPAPRPAYSVLGTEKGHILPSLENALGRYFQEKKILYALAD